MAVHKKRKLNYLFAIFIVLVLISVNHSSGHASIKASDYSKVELRRICDYKHDNRRYGDIKELISDTENHDHLLIRYSTESYKDVLEKGIRRKCDLSFIDLSNKNLDYINLNKSANRCRKHNKARLNRANFNNSELNSVCLQNADLRQAYLNNTKLVASKINDASFEGAKINNSTLNQSNLKNSLFYNAELSDSNLIKVNLYNAELNKAKLTGANLSGADLRKADLTGADLTNANLAEAKLQGAIFKDTIIDNANFSSSNLSHSIFEPEIEVSYKYNKESGRIYQISFPIVESFSNVKGLKDLSYLNNSSALVALEQELKNSGLEEPAKQVQCSIKRSRLKNQEVNPKILGFIYKSLVWITLDFTNAYGAEPLRPLLLLVFTILFFSFFYSTLLIFHNTSDSFVVVKYSKTYTKNKHVVTEENANLVNLGESLLYLYPYKDLTDKIISSLFIVFKCTSYFRRVLDKILWVRNTYIILQFGLLYIIDFSAHRKFHLLRKISFRKLTPRLIASSMHWSIYISILNSFRLGIGDFEISSWISLLLPRKIEIELQGIYRTIGGIQSLMSVYLIALWVIFSLERVFSHN